MNLMRPAELKGKTYNGARFKHVALDKKHLAWNSHGQGAPAQMSSNKKPASDSCRPLSNCCCQ